ncbi:MAG: hypothetical protein DVB31_05880 [Verrucomicrobia bacterium]|nr:MAG: hypothetical protein DVB31_05880 [Verrucomicrobiota bacterium]
MSVWEQVFWHGGKFLGIEWHVWKVVGWVGNAVFTSRFLVQWYATEKHGRVTVPALFWWLSLGGALLLLAYAACYQHDSVFVAAYAFSWLPYLRNLFIHRRTEKARPTCGACGVMGQSGARFCAQCGASLAPGT